MKALVATLFPGGSAGDDFTKVEQEGCDLDKEVTSIDQEVDKLLGFADYASSVELGAPAEVSIAMSVYLNFYRDVSVDSLI